MTDTQKPAPVAWRWRVDDENPWEYSDFDHGGAEPLYTADQLDAAVRAAVAEERAKAKAAVIEVAVASLRSRYPRG